MSKSSVIIGRFGPSARQILDAAIAVASKPQTKLVVKSMPEGSTVLGGAAWEGRRQKDYERGLGYLHELAGRSTLVNQVFLGGACGVPWRDGAIKSLDGEGVAFYNPEVADWDEQDKTLKAMGVKGGIMEHEAIQKAASYVLLFVFDPGTRAIATLNECVEFMMAGKQKVVIVAAYLQPGTVIGGQTVTFDEAMDINIARAELFGIAKSKGISVYDSVEAAVNRCIYLAKVADADVTIADYLGQEKLAAVG